MLTLLALGEHVHVVLAGSNVPVGVLEALLCKWGGRVGVGLEFPSLGYLIKCALFNCPCKRAGRTTCLI
jgi:hypothetical protein